MKKIFQLKETRSEKIAKMDTLVSAEMNDTQRGEYDNLAKEVEVINADIKRMEDFATVREDRNFTISKNEGKDTEEGQFARAFGEWYKTGASPVDFRGTSDRAIVIPKMFYRADPLLTTTNTSIINKTVGGLNIKETPAQAILSALGVPMYSGLTGNFVLPSAAEMVAGFVGEGADVSTGSFAPANITLAPRGVGISQSWSKEYATQINADIISKMVQNMLNAIYVEVAKDLFVQIKSDAAVSAKAHVGGTFGQATILGMEASLGYLGAYKFVSDKNIAKKLKTWDATHGQKVWEGNQVLTYDALALPIISGNAFLGDFGDAGIGQWGDIELIIDPYKYAASRKNLVTANGLFDSGASNPRGFVWVSDTSVY